MSNSNALATLTSLATIAIASVVASPARAGTVSDKLANALATLDRVADDAQGAYDEVARVVNAVVGVAQDAAPVVVPVAERAVKAVTPIGEAVGAYVGREVAPAVDEAARAATSVGANVVANAGGALKARGVDVEPVVSVVANGAQAAYGVAKPALEQTARFLQTATPNELARAGAEVLLAYVLFPVVLNVIADITRGYRGDLRPIDAYDALISGGNVVIIDTRGADVTVALPGGSSKKVLSCDVDADAKVTALKITALRGVKKSTKVILLDQSGNSAKKLAKSLSALGYGKVFTVRGGFSAWSRQGLATTAA